MNFKDLVKLINGETVRVGKHQIYFDKDEDNKNEGFFVLEQYEYTTENNVDMFSVVDGFKNIEIAINTAKKIK